ncbi:MAG: hypothetical protein NPINA01_24090 [Nitrospinaceae bacterium]|nr:MAG: hypothetical protein NPINA01_24090 [Nitrospinaceae bacterium]
MKLRAGFLFFNYLLTAMGLTCLAFSQVFSLLTGIFLLSGLSLCLVLEVKKILPLKPPVRILSSSWALLALPFLYFGFDIPLLDLLVWFLVFLLFSRIILKTELNDYLFGYMLTLICLLLGAMVIHQLVFAALFLSFYMVLCWGLIHYNLMAERIGSHSPPEVFNRFKGKESIRGSLIGFSAGLMTLSLILTTLIFAAFPRFGAGLVPSGPPTPVSGFSEAVRLGDVGRIKKNDQVVMRIEFNRDGKPYRPQGPVFWRGVVLDHFNGSAWFSTAKPRWRYFNQPGVGTRLFPFDRGPGLLRQNIFMDGFDSNVIFTQGVPLFVDGDFHHLQINMNSALKTMDQSPHPKSVTLISDAAASSKSRNRDPFEIKSEAQQKRFLQLPDVSPEITRLAKTLTRNAASSEAKANSILNHLQSDFEYTLDMKGKPGQTTLDHFLFDRKKGHCEYFASSMVVLLRIAGIPARLVNGFFGIEWNDFGQYMVVRQTHAHSWVEAYFPGKGWVVYDPTPADPAFSESGFQDPLSRAFDLLRLNWQRYIVRYSLNDQSLIFSRLKSTGEETLQTLQKLGTIERKEIKSFIFDNLEIYLLTVGFGILLIVVWKNHLSWRLSASSRHPFPAWLYRKMLGKLKTLGIEKQPHWTHREFLQKLTALPPEKRTIVEKITATYEKSRFGQTPLLATEKKELLNHLRNI